VSEFIPIPGAAGFQLSNPSALDTTAVIASLEVFSLTSMSALRQKSIALTAYLEDLLLHPQIENLEGRDLPYKIITPSNPAERGAQLSILLRPGLLDGVMKKLEDAGIVVDERRPDVIRVAPAPLYNNFTEVWDFVEIFAAACLKAQGGQSDGGPEAVAFEGQEEKGWAQIK
jgi:kynureninase